jgi:hypothetical protein
MQCGREAMPSKPYTGWLGRILEKTCIYLLNDFEKFVGFFLSPS